VTIGSGPKVFSSGFDLKFWAAKKGNVELALKTFHVLLARILTCNVNTLCVINGFAVAGGVFLALAHDQAIMSSNPAWRMFLNETTNGLPVPGGFVDLTLSTTSGGVARILLNEKKLTPQDALRLGIVKELYDDTGDLENKIK